VFEKQRENTVENRQIKGSPQTQWQPEVAQGYRRVSPKVWQGYESVPYSWRLL